MNGDLCRSIRSNACGVALIFLDKPDLPHLPAPRQTRRPARAGNRKGLPLHLRARDEKKLP